MRRLVRRLKEFRGSKAERGWGVEKRVFRFGGKCAASGRNDDFLAGVGERFARCANTLGPKPQA